VVKRTKKLIPIICEICGNDNIAVLHKHHIVERTDPNTSNNEWNLAVICSNCHNKTHAGQIKIIGLFPSTKLPYGRTLIYEEKGYSNAPDLKDPPFKSKAESMRVYEKTKG
jgi:hypothetical protein